MKRVFVNGTFDIIHAGHIYLLNFAKEQGNHLLVAIDTDRRVKEKKGNSRPINNEFERKLLLLNLKSVDDVKFFDSDEELIEILLTYKPNIIVKGSDHKENSRLSKQHCDEVIFYDRIDQYSTTKKIQDIASR
jgi:D-beta-D-heptose 7-phosphate kinase/D-beta-D-heptose 1-phosphate adenosyltransferase